MQVKQRQNLNCLPDFSQLPSGFPQKKSKVAAGGIAAGIKELPRAGRTSSERNHRCTTFGMPWQRHAPYHLKDLAEIITDHQQWHGSHGSVDDARGVSPGHRLSPVSARAARAASVRIQRQHSGLHVVSRQLFHLLLVLFGQHGAPFVKS